MSTEIEVKNVLLYGLLTVNAKFLLSFLKLKLHCRINIKPKVRLTNFNNRFQTILKGIFLLKCVLLYTYLKDMTQKKVKKCYSF